MIYRATHRHLDAGHGHAGARDLVPTALGGGLLLLAATAVAAATPAGPIYAAAVMLAYLPVAAGVIHAAPRLHPHPRFGLANALTLGRAMLACLAAGLLAEPAALDGPAALPWLLPGGAALALLLDLADGAAARRRGLASEFGRRFDMEVDAWLILILAAVAVVLGAVPAWALAVGLMRYLYVAAALAWPVLARPLPYSLRRRVVCGVQVVALGAALAPPLAGTPAAIVVAVALAALAWSFALDIHRQAASPRGDA